MNGISASNQVPFNVIWDSEAVMDPADTIIKLNVGEARTEFNVHESILIASSGDLRNQMKPEWIQQRKERNIIVLPSDDPEIVRAYVRWLYNPSRIPLPDDRQSASGYVRLAKMYVFGEARIDVKFKNAVIEAFILATPKYQCYPPAEALRVVYKGTSPGSGARRLLADFIAYNAKEDDPEWNQEMESYKGEMWMDVMKAMTRLRKPEPGYPWMISSAPYRQDES